MSKEAMKQALDFLRSGHFVYPTKIATDLEEALINQENLIPSNSTELEKQEQSEPVAVRQSNGEIYVLGSALVPIGAYLYTTPQQRTWVGLTDEEANELWESTDSDWELMKRVEAKLKEKNT